LRTPPEDAVAKQLKDAGVEVQTIDDTWTRKEPGPKIRAMNMVVDGKSSRLSRKG
jgi:hypothetical protein